MILEVSCDPRVERMLGKLIRVQTPEFDGYGVVTRITGGMGDVEFCNATIACDEERVGV